MADNTKSYVNNEEICAVCKIATKKKCGNCNLVYYCNREHQTVDWRSHSKNCHPCKLVDDPILGRHYIATRMIKIDELVFRENTPLIKSLRLDPGPLACLNCYEPMTTYDEMKQCNRCGWYLCTNCTRHGPECELTLKYRKSKITIDEYKMFSPEEINDVFFFFLQFLSYFTSRAIFVMRALALRENEPKAYQRLLSLDDPYIKETNQSIGIPLTRSEITGLIKRLMRMEDVSEAEILKIIGIAEVNCISIRPNSCVLFHGTAPFKHNCHPNSFVKITKEGAVVIRAAVAIPKDNPITICYGSARRATAQRRLTLATTKSFHCNCSRCKDPTEFGTMFSAVKCTNEACTGHMLPPTFVVSNGEIIPDFICNTCNLTTDSLEIDYLLTEISQQFSNIDRTSVNELKHFIDLTKQSLHANHSHIFVAEYYLACAMADEDNLKSATMEVLQENITLCYKLIHLIETLMPGIYFYRGHLHYLVYLTIREILLKRQPNVTVSRNRVKECKTVLNEAYRLCRHELLEERALEDVREGWRQVSAYEQTLPLY